MKKVYQTPQSMTILLRTEKSLLTGSASVENMSSVEGSWDEEETSVKEEKHLSGTGYFW